LGLASRRDEGRTCCLSGHLITWITFRDDGSTMTRSSLTTA
jgi:hypothetical protein